MSSILSEVNIMDEFILPINDREFKEFCEDLNQLELILDTQIYVEARVQNTNEKISHKIGDALKQTAETTKNVYDAYDNVTDGGGSFLKGIWGLVNGGISIISRMIKFILDNLGKVLGYILKVAKTIGSIPGNIKNKIRGNIKLYIAVEDLQFFYNTMFPDVRNFIALTSEMAKGEVWTTFFRPDSTAPKDEAGRNDMALSKKMKSVYNKMNSQIRFEPTVIEMRNPNILDTYFGNEKAVKFNDLSGRSHQSTYYEALASLLEDLKQFNTPLSNIQKDIGIKFDKAQANASFAKLSRVQQESIKDNIQMISKVVSIIGNLVKYIITDMGTIQKSCNTILKKQDMVPVTTGKK